MDVAELRAWSRGTWARSRLVLEASATTFAHFSSTTGFRSSLTGDEAALALTTEGEVLNALRRQIEGMRAASYNRSETLSSEVVAINATSALHTAEFSRQRIDGSEMRRLRVSYLITIGANGRRMSALAVHAR